MFTYYLIKVAWGGDARVCARVAINLMLTGCQILCCGVAKISEKFFYENIPKMMNTHDIAKSVHKFNILFQKRLRDN